MRPSQISAWLSGISETPISHVPTTSTSHKRPLVEVSGNTITMSSETPSRKRTKMSPLNTDDMDTPRTPVSALRLVPSPIFPLSEEGEDEENIDSQQSPQASAHSNVKRSETPTNQTSTASSKRKRQGSPARAISLLRAVEYPLYDEFITHWSAFSSPAQPMAQDLEEFSTGNSLIGQEDKSLAYRLIPDTDTPMLDEYKRKALIWDQRSSLGRLPDLEFADRLTKEQLLTSNLKREESHWNVFVHGPLLKHALENGAHGDQVRVESITHASISPHALVPQYSATQASPSKTVDFALTLPLSLAHERLLLRNNIMSVNQTMSEALRFAPIAVSFETKLPGSNLEEAKLQLAVWGLAQRRRLVSLLQHVGKAGARIPPLPLVIILGYEWQLYYLEMEDEKAFLKGHIPIAQTHTRLGIYAGVAAVQRLADWAQTTYREWFETNIIQPLEQKRISELTKKT